jgi:3-phytase
MMRARLLIVVIACALGASCGGFVGAQIGAAPAPEVSRVPAALETPPVGAAGDAADDPAIWAAADPAMSRVIGTQKQGGLYVYDLSGRVVQEIAYGRPNNVDLVADFAWADGPAPLVVASDRADNSITLWRLDLATGLLETAPRARVLAGWGEIYGVCAARLAEGVVVAATSVRGEVGFWRLAPEGGAERLGGFAFATITEGCVFDAANRAVYFAEENRGIWRVPLPGWDGAGRTLIDAVGDGRLVADVEGLALWEGAGGAGWLVASVQGRSAFALYDRSGANGFRSLLEIGPSPDGGADGVSGTDGIAVVSAPLGPAFPRGLMVVQDDENTAPAALQNFKFVSWAAVESALEE